MKQSFKSPYDKGLVSLWSSLIIAQVPIQDMTIKDLMNKKIRHLPSAPIYDIIILELEKRGIYEKDEYRT